VTLPLLWASLAIVVVLLAGVLCLQTVWLAWRLDRLELLIRFRGPASPGG
jgi:hypothetical protein